jgi:methionyl aminopeptidase
MAIAYRSRTEIESIRRAGQVVMEILAILRDAVRPGVTTGELDAIAARELKARGATSNFKGYRPAAGIPPFPGVICASVNDEIVHGIPGGRALADGDIIAVDFGAIVDGWHGDSAITVPVGTVDAATRHLLEVTEEALRRGIAAVRPENHVLDISRAVGDYIESEGCSVVRQYGGHGIGRALHEDPWIPNYIEPGQPNPLLRRGMVFCIEPMVNLGRAETRELDDHWTVCTADGSRSAHFEHTIAVTMDGADVLTAM